MAALEGRNEENTEPIEIDDEKILYIVNYLSAEQKHRVLNMVQKKSKEFAWYYLDMKGIHPDTCIHHIYTNDEIIIVRKP